MLVPLVCRYVTDLVLFVLGNILEGEVINVVNFSRQSAHFDELIQCEENSLIASVPTENILFATGFHHLFSTLPLRERALCTGEGAERLTAQWLIVELVTGQSRA